jgi:hypothetical protein
MVISVCFGELFELAMQAQMAGQIYVPGGSLTPTLDCFNHLNIWQNIRSISCQVFSEFSTDPSLSETRRLEVFGSTTWIWM